MTWRIWKPRRHLSTAGIKNQAGSGVKRSGESKGGWVGRHFIALYFKDIDITVKPTNQEVESSCSFTTLCRRRRSLRRNKLMEVLRSSSLLLLFLLPLLFSSLSSCIPYNSDESDALISLKLSFFDPHHHLSNWINGTSPCSWHGLLCNHTSHSVISLDLSFMNLSGSISPAIGRLHNLVNLSLAVNNLSGPLPPEICNIGCSLVYLNISNNLLDGHFPAPNLSNLVSLEVLDAYNNNFTGPLPLEISKLTNMRHLHLGGNYFDGSIPPQYGDMQSLQYLALSGNSLTGRIPVELGTLSLLQELYLGYYNEFQGGIPSALGLLTELVILDMANCGLTGNIPAQLENLTKLDSLFLQINSLTGPIPPQLGGLVSLRSLDLSNNALSGHIPDQLRNLVNLELLNLFRNQLHGQIPSFLGDLPSLQVLSLWENNMTGMVPQQLGSNGKLVVLDISSNGFTGPVPPHLCFGGNLQKLILLNNFFTGPIPESLGNCTTLERIRLGRNRLSGPIPTGLLALPLVQIIEIPLNDLSGSLPENIPFNSKLGRLDLSDNLLNGSIPPSIGNLSALQAFLLPGNQLSGSIPSQVSGLKRLSKVDWSDNALAGSIPPALGDCIDLTYLDLSRNNLDGEIPDQLHNLAVLDFMNLSRNHLSGAIPSSLQEMQTLTAADFSFNNLSGLIPDQGQFATFNASSFIGNAGLCGAQLAPCGSSGMSASSLRHRVQSEPALLYWIIVGTISSLTVVVFVVGVFYNRHAFCALLGRDTLDSPWKLTAFQRVDFTANHVLECLTDDNIIGKGGSGTVYRCLTPSGTVAVKKLPGNCKGASDDHGFSAEIQTLGKIRHRHIVRLLGCCSSRETNLLVYEYMPNGSLGELLHGPRGGALDWAKRYRIAVESANGLRYLHHDCSPLIVHRDVKSNNILLDSKYEAHVADFGLAKVLHYPESMSSVAGSYGYIAPGTSKCLVNFSCSSSIKFSLTLLRLFFNSLSSFLRLFCGCFPDVYQVFCDAFEIVFDLLTVRCIVAEYAYTLKVDEKSDIYSFGVVLLELLTGRRPIEPEYGEGVDIAQWVRKKVQTREGTLEVLDSRMGVTESSEQMQEVMLVLRVALHCLADLPMQRPTMREVVQMLTDLPKSKAAAVVAATAFTSKPNTESISSGSISPPDLISI